MDKSEIEPQRLVRGILVASMMWLASIVTFWFVFLRN